jgi:death-on-curing family protein
MIRYFNTERIFKIHEKALKKSGGLQGFKDKDGISKVCDFVQNDDYYPTFEEKLSYIIFSISKNHFFNDGNKRTALVCGAYFLIINGYKRKIDLYMTDMETHVVELVERKIDNKELIEILKKYI